jgi:hypothetical protein
LTLPALEEPLFVAAPGAPGVHAASTGRLAVPNNTPPARRRNARRLASMCGI